MNRPPLQKLTLLITTLVVVLFTAQAASAAGRVVWKKTKIKESNESWRVNIEFHMNSTPDFAHVPMRFKFEPKTYFERSLLDGKEGPQFRRVPLVGQSPLIETVDVGFMDPGTGKTQKRTRFSFKLTRARGFEAGEYAVQVENKRTGRKIGGAKTITLDGENEVIDRRSISFDTKKKKKKKEDEAKDSEPAYDPSEDPNNDAYWAGGPEEPEGDDPTLPPPAHMQEKPGACGCRTVGHDSGPSNAGWLLMLLGLAAFTGRGVQRTSRRG